MWTSLGTTVQLTSLQMPDFLALHASCRLLPSLLCYRLDTRGVI